VFYFPTFATHAETTTSNQTRSVAIVDFRLAPDQLSVNPDAVPWQSGIRDAAGITATVTLRLRRALVIAIVRPRHHHLVAMSAARTPLGLRRSVFSG